jgi:DMSO reductase iron-sulfur subunit
MAKQRGFYVDIDRCIGCMACSMACKNENQTDVDIHWRDVLPLTEEFFPLTDRAFLTVACNHCEKPECLRVCPTESYTKRADDGVVIHHPETCIGCRMCVYGCPYGVPKFNGRTKKVEKCDFCAHRLAEGQNPACVDACPVQALLMIEDVRTFEKPRMTSSGYGFPEVVGINPAIRIMGPKVPEIVKRET